MSLKSKIKDVVERIATEFNSVATALNNKVDKVTGSSLIQDTSITRLADTSGTNTGDQDLSPYSTATGVEDNADVTDTTNVTAAGALMGSELTSIVDVKAIDQSLISGAAPVFDASNMTNLPEASVDVLSNVATARILGRTTAGSGDSEELTVVQVRSLINVENGATADQTGAQIKAAYEIQTNAYTDAKNAKLSSIEDSADVTDTANVTIAGALMDSEVTNLAQVKAFDSSNYAASLGIDDNYVTDAEAIVIGNTSGTNTGDENTSSIQSKRPLKTIESLSLEGNGDIDLTKTMVGLSSVDNTSDEDKPISTATQLELNKKQEELVSGTNIKTINSATLLGTGDIEINGSSPIPFKTLASPANEIDFAGDNLELYNWTSPTNEISFTLTNLRAGVQRIIRVQNATAVASEVLINGDGSASFIGNTDNWFTDEIMEISIFGISTTEYEWWYNTKER